LDTPQGKKVLDRIKRVFLRWRSPFGVGSRSSQFSYPFDASYADVRDHIFPTRNSCKLERRELGPPPPPKISTIASHHLRNSLGYTGCPEWRPQKLRFYLSAPQEIPQLIHGRAHPGSNDVEPFVSCHVVAEPQASAPKALGSVVSSSRDYGVFCAFTALPWSS